MLDPDIFYNAALNLYDRPVNFACGAILYETKCDDFGTCKYIAKFSEIFKPEGKDLHGSWFGYNWLNRSRFDRSLALLFCAEIVKEETP